jgi:hypothetical protein
MSCVSTPRVVTCTGGVGAVVTFPPPATSGGSAPSGTTT